MKSLVCVTILLTICVDCAFGAISAGFFNDPKNPGKCTINENLVLSPGDIVKNPNQSCGRILCGGKGFAEFHTCGSESYEGCTLGDYVDKSLPYPDCCKRYIMCVNKN